MLGAFSSFFPSGSATDANVETSAEEKKRSC